MSNQTEIKGEQILCFQLVGEWEEKPWNPRKSLNNVLEKQGFSHICNWESVSLFKNSDFKLFQKVCDDWMQETGQQLLVGKGTENNLENLEFEPANKMQTVETEYSIKIINIYEACENINTYFIPKGTTIRAGFLKTLEKCLAHNRKKKICFDNSRLNNSVSNQMDDFFQNEENEKYTCKYEQVADKTILYSGY